MIYRSWKWPFLLVLFLSQATQAAVTPLSLGVAPPVQFPSSDFSITGLRTSLLWGRHRDVYGLDLGLLGNITDQRFVGVGLAGGFNATFGQTTILGLQLAGIGNYNKQKINTYGLQAALGFNYNSAESGVYGLQLALANIAAHTTVAGLQVGLYNRARTVYGLQIGVANFCESLHGLQIGLINFHSKGVIGVAPILNAGF